MSISLLVLAGWGCTSREAKLARHRERAERYFAEKSYDRAEIEYINVLRLANKEIPEVIRNLGLIYQDQGKTSKAFAFLTKAKELDAEDLHTRTKLALVYLANHEFTNALNEIDFVLQKQPANAEALEILPDTAFDTNSVALVKQRLESVRAQAENTASFHVAFGKLYYRTHDYEKAAASFQRALELDPKSIAANWGAGSVFLTQTNVAKAEAQFKIAEQLTPQRSPYRLNYATYKVQSGDMAAARSILEAVTKAVPDYLPALNQFANLALSETNYTECATLVDKVLSQDSINLEALMLSARLKLAQGKPAESIADLDKLIETYPAAILGYYHRAVAYLVNQQTDKAMRDLRQVVSLYPDYADAVYLLAELLIRNRDGASAVTLLSDFLKRYPNAGRAQFLLANAYQSLDRLDEALAICRGLLDRGATEPRIPLLAGTVLRQQGKKAEARSFFEKTLKLNPDYLPALNQLAGMDADDQNWDAAVKRIQDRIQANPKSAELTWMLANLFQAKAEAAGKAGNTNEVQAATVQAEQALAKTIALNPDVGKAYTKLAGIYLARGEAPKAIAQLEEGLSHNTNDVDALVMKALIQERLKQYDQARATYEQILTINPDLSSVQNNLAYLLSEHLGDLDKAYEVATRARKTNPNDPALTDTVGWIQFKRGDYAAALVLLQESARRLPDIVDIQLHFGLALYMRGREKEAQTTLQKVVQSKTAVAGKDKAQQCLKVLATTPKTAGAKELLEKVHGGQPADPVAAIRLGAIYEAASAWDKAQAVYQKTLELNPKLLSMTLGLARLYAGPLNNAKKALEYAKSARELAPDDPEVAFTLGRLAYQSADFKWAFSLLQESALKRPGKPDTLYALAWSQYSLGHIPAARASMQKALQPNAQAPFAEDAKRFLALTELYVNPAKLNSAQAQVQAVVQQQPDYVPGLMAAALIYELQGNVAAAKQACEKALARYPSFTPADKQLALLYLKEPPDYQKAYDHAAKAREAFPNDAEVAKALGIAVYQRKDYSRTVQLLKQSITQRAFDAELLFYLGMAHKQLKQNAEAKEALQKAVTLKPTAAFAPEAKKALAEMEQK